MSIAWDSFTPGPALVGGAIIGLAATLLLLFNGRIAGISGILGGLLRPGPDARWQAAFIAGLVFAPVFWALAGTLPPMRIEADTPALVVAGLLVGIGTRYGAGCTSGHGVCGLSRLSPRSLAATLCFMGGGFLTVYLLRHVFSS